MQQENITTVKKAPFLHFLFHCLIAGLSSGLLVTFLLGLLVILFSSLVHAETESISEESGLIPVRNPADVTKGSLLFKVDGNYLQAPTLNTDVQITVTGMIARVTVSQTFCNPDNDWKEGTYVFPLPESAAVDHMRLKIGERIIEGQIKERNQARKQYEKARNDGKKASLVEQERPNIFTTSVANIGPRESVIVIIEYQEIIRYDSGIFQLRFPMVVAPRYIPGETRIQGFQGNGWSANTDQVPDAARVTPPVLHPDQGPINPVTLRINLDTGFTLGQIASPYHTINISEITGMRYNIELAAGDVPADRDFVLNWEPAPSDQPQAALFTEQKGNESYALIMLMPPKRSRAETLQRELIFVIDTSGSMSGPSILQAKSALELTINRLRPGDRFNIIQFNSWTHQLFQFPQPVSHQSLRQAHAYINQLKADGGTEMAPALIAALDQHTNSYDIRQVVFLTDGSIGNENELFGIIREQLSNSRLFTIGIGSAPNSYFMQRAANFGRGTYTFIGKIDEVHEKMDALFRKLESPVLTNLQIDWTGHQDIEAWPARIPDLYTGEPLLITARGNSFPDVINISGKVSQSDWNASLNLNGGQKRTGISVLWARKKIAALMDQLNDASESENIRKLITETAIQHHLVSKYTSLVAVDITPSRVRDAILKSTALPTNLPADWNYEKVFGHMPATATSAGLKLIAGLILLLTSLLFRLTRKDDHHV